MRLVDVVSGHKINKLCVKNGVLTTKLKYTILIKFTCGMIT